MSIRIVLADDHTIVREGLRLMIDAHPEMTVVGEAENGQEAVRIAGQVRPDVMLMDISMPELNGIEATRMILLDQPSMHIIILSMHLSSEHVERALLAGAQGYLLKASASAELVTAIQTVMNGGRFLTQRVSDILIEDLLVLSKGRQESNPLERLSARELETLHLVLARKTTQEIADILSLSTSTVDTYRSRLMHKLGLHNLQELIHFAIRHGLVTPE